MKQPTSLTVGKIYNEPNFHFQEPSDSFRTTGVGDKIFDVCVAI